MASLVIIGAGPHGREIASFTGGELFDDHIGPTPDCRPDLPWLAGAAWPKVRRQIAMRHGACADALDDGNIRFPGAQISPDVEWGRHVHVGYNAVVAHGCKLGDFVNICPGVVLAGDVTVEDDVFIGANATVIHGGITIGRGALIGAGAVVIGDVPEGATVVGVPARRVK